jgi:pimeloyl-ACP methyl ester carboxylesterase
VSVLAVPGGALVYDVIGEGSVVVLVHGFALDMRMWDEQVDYLSGEFRVVRYDCRGFGRSGRLDPAVPYTHADDLVALLDHLDVDDAVLVGLSFGGQVALEAALQAPRRVRGLVLLDSVVDGIPWDDVSEQGQAELGRCVASDGVEGGRRAWLAHPLFAAARERPAVAERLAAMVGDYLGQHWLGEDSHRDAPSSLGALDQIRTPALIVVGDRDVAGFVEMSEVLATRIPGAVLRRVPRAGHMVNMEEPDIVNELIAEFLRGLPRRR